MNKRNYSSTFLIVILLLSACSNKHPFKEVKRPVFVENRGFTFLQHSHGGAGFVKEEHYVEIDGFAVENQIIKNSVWELEYHISDYLPSLSDFSHPDKVQLGKEVCYYVSFNEEIDEFNYSYSSSVNLSRSSKYQKNNSKDVGYFCFMLPYFDFSPNDGAIDFVCPEQIIVNIYLDGKNLCRLIDVLPNDFYTPFFVFYGYSDEKCEKLNEAAKRDGWFSNISSKLSAIQFNVYPKYMCESITKEKIKETWCIDHYSIDLLSGINLEQLKWSFYQNFKCYIQNDTHDNN